jgi:hypothetical protein
VLLAPGAQRYVRRVLQVGERRSVLPDGAVLHADARPVQQLGRRFSEDALGRGIHRDDAALGVLVHDALEHGLE